MTLGGASNCPSPSVLLRLLIAPVWYVAHDLDGAGEKAAGHWTASYGCARRVAPPLGKDWTEAGTNAPGTRGTGVDLRRWWGEILDGSSSPPLFRPEELTRWRWGPAAGDPEPGIVIGRPEAHGAAPVHGKPIAI